ncbi:hypothetical protein IGI04_005649 [Brassica rapa subsp. trilocularis]|uniref:F-box domain-containing protein n=1 Tax=Brassica rapa subsp. trilocularis TaxID=1813537 RepID=A0ABQ7NGX7_BRACM|nr:hypothetical protein IGI04_005649 [Brassica rapa subsp. trilocularis]
MVRKLKASQARPTLTKDAISQLPNDLTCQILSLLSTKEAVKTSVLSTRWRHLWLSLPCLELKSREFLDLKNFTSFGDRFFDSTRVTLSDAEFVSLPSLKTMHLEYIEFPNEATFETLVLCSPVLECLKIVVASDDEKVFRVHSRSLKRLTFERVSPFLFDSAGVVIDAPRLCFLNINDNISKSVIIHKLESNAVLQISLLGIVRLEEFDDEFFDDIYEVIVSSKISNIHKFLHGISMARSMKICRGTFKIMCHYSKLEPFPQFSNMSYLDITLYPREFKWLPAFLESFPNLKYLALVMVCDDRKGGFSEDIDQVSFSSVPECLLSSLEFVELIAPVQYDVELKLVKYLLKNSAVLEKLILRLASYNSRRDYMLKKLLKIPRVSTKCKVVIL